MADTKISALTALTAPASGDLIPIVDISDTTMAASGTTKGITYSNLGFLPLAGGTVTGAIIQNNTSGNMVNTINSSASGEGGIYFKANSVDKFELYNNGSAFFGLYNYTTAGNSFQVTSADNEFRVNGPLRVDGSTVNFSANPTLGVGVITSTVASGNNNLILDGTGEVGVILKNTGAGKWQLYDNGTSLRLYNYTTAAHDVTVLRASGNVGIGTTSPSYQLHVNTDSAGKPGVGGLWTVVSDERIKANIVPADLSRCYDIVKQVGLKHYGYKPGVYSDAQVKDRNSLGWIAQDVQKVFSKAVSVKPFTLQTDIPDGTETYEEQAFTVHIANKVETSIQIIDGKPVRVSKDVQTEEKVMLFDDVAVVDEGGDVVLVDDEPLTHKMPRMVTKTRPKVRREVIEDCLDLNAGQMHAALYGAVQHLMSVVEAQAEAIAELQASV